MNRLLLLPLLLLASCANRDVFETSCPMRYVTNAKPTKCLSCGKRYIGAHSIRRDAPVLSLYGMSSKPHPAGDERFFQETGGTTGAVTPGLYGSRSEAWGDAYQIDTHPLYLRRK